MGESKRYRLTVELLEDLHTGTGTGAGDIDALQLRDRQGRPVIRANHLKGLLLAAGEELASYIASVKPQLQRLLGTGGAGRGLLRLTGLRLAPNSGSHMLVWTSSAREAGDRRPKDDTMRMVEHVAAGSVFVAELRHPDDEGVQALLARLIRRLDHFGSDRSRGSGLVRSRLEVLDPVKAPIPKMSERVLRLKLRNLEPLCLPTTGHPGNLIRSASFVRGQALHGALMAWALSRRDPHARMALVPASVGDALPLPEGMDTANLSSIQVLPIPLSVHSTNAKLDPTPLPWWVARGSASEGYDDLAPRSAAPSGKPKRAGNRELLARSRSQGPWQRYSPFMAVHMRNQTADLADISGRPLTEPQLFSVEEIAEETSFITDLHFPDEPSAQRFADAFAPILTGGEWLALGREGRPATVAAFACLTVDGKPPAFGDTWTLTLTSDLVARGPSLGFLGDLDVPALVGLVGCALSDFPGCEQWQMRGFAETEALHGFNAASGQRRAPVLAIRRGACWKIIGEGSGALASRLAAMPALGERTSEGCGRFWLDLQPVSFENTSGEGKSAAPENRAEVLLVAVARFAKDPHVAKPSLSQLQWLRNRALAATDETQIRGVLNAIREAPLQRPRGAGAWSGFPVESLQRELDALRDIAERRLFISQLVQWLASRVRSKAEEIRR